ncbi:MAG: DUF6782 family putative metallopeptidase [Pseudomonadota bacterium]
MSLADKPRHLRGPKPKRKASRGRPGSGNRVDLSKRFKFDYADGEDGEYELSELKSIFNYAIDTLAESPTFTAMMRASGRKKFKVVFDDTLEEYGSIDPEERVIYLSSHAPPEQLISTLAHEIRHALQYETVLKPAQVDRLKRKDFIVWNMLLEADAASTEAQVNAELAHTALGQLSKEHSTKMPMYRTVHSAFERAVKKNPMAMADGSAQLAAFKRYFKTKLVDIYKDGFSEYYRELRHDGVVADKHIPNAAAKALGWHVSGGNYLDRDKQLANRTGASLRKNAQFFGADKRKRGRSPKLGQPPLLDPRRVSLMERCEALGIPLFARPVQPQGVTGRPLRPF